MKHFFSFLLVAAMLFCAVESRAGIIIGNFTLTTITTAQSNTVPVFTNTAYFYIPQIVTITNNTLSISNAYIGMFRYSPDNGTTWFTNNCPVFIPTNAAAMTYTIGAQQFQVPMVMELL